MRVDHEKKTDGVRVDHEQVRWGESSPLERAMGFRVHHEKERWGESSP